MSIKSVFVTCGATVPFPELVQSVITESFAQELLRYGYGRMIVQFGKGYRTHFEEQLKDFKNDSKTCSLSACDLGSETAPSHFILAEGNLEVIGIEYSSKIQQIIGNFANLVISHAGTGSILDSIRMNKPLIVCVNDTLMDNHQQQIADKFEAKRYVWSCGPKEIDIISCLHKTQEETLSVFPQAYNTQFENTLINLAYH